MTLRFFCSRRTSPVTLAAARAFGSSVTSPSLFTSRTFVNSTEAPLLDPSRSTWITWPGATRYCLPPVAITASMSWNPSPQWKWSPLPSRAHIRPRHRGGSQARRALSAPPDRPTSPRSRCRQVVRQALPQEQTRAVHARLHRRQADVQGLGDLRVRQPLHVVEQERRPVVLGELVDRAGQHRPQLRLQRRLLDLGGPVAD